MNGFGKRVVLITPEDQAFEYTHKFEFKVSNNEVDLTCPFKDVRPSGSKLSPRRVRRKRAIYYLILSQDENLDSHSKTNSTLSKLNKFVYLKHHLRAKLDGFDHYIQTLKRISIYSPKQYTKKTWLIVGVHYFTKCIKAEATSIITEQTVRKFIDYVKQFGIKLSLVVYHPQRNEQPKAANKQILRSLRKRCEDQKLKWLDKLLGTLCALRTTKKEVVGHTPFNLKSHCKAPENRRPCIEKCNLGLERQGSRETFSKLGEAL
ncbi:Pro-Pol polyprotein [Bienertia sinuspersici]